MPEAQRQIPEKQEYRFRAYARATDSGWYINCIDLCLDAEAETFDQAVRKLDDALVGYIQVVLDKKLGKEFLCRPSSWEHYIRYYEIKIRIWVRSLFSVMRLPKQSKYSTIDRSVPLPCVAIAA